jgi:hypothetical protein
MKTEIVVSYETQVNFYDTKCHISEDTTLTFVEE